MRRNGTVSLLRPAAGGISRLQDDLSDRRSGSEVDAHCFGFFLVDGGFYRKSWIFPFESIRICCTMKYKRFSFSCLNDFSLMTVTRGMSIV